VNSTWFYLNKDWGCVILREIDFLLKICLSIICLHPSWKVHTWTEICASLDHRKKTKADGSRLIPRKHTETLVLLSVYHKWFPSRWIRTALLCEKHIKTFLEHICKSFSSCPVHSKQIFHPREWRDWNRPWVIAAITRWLRIHTAGESHEKNVAMKWACLL